MPVTRLNNLERTKVTHLTGVMHLVSHTILFSPPVLIYTTPGVISSLSSPEAEEMRGGGGGGGAYPGYHGDKPRNC